MRMLWLIYAVTCYVAYSAGTSTSSSDEQAPTYDEYDLKPFEKFSRTFVQATFGNKEIFGGCSPLSAAFDKLEHGGNWLTLIRGGYFDLPLDVWKSPSLVNRYAKLPTKSHSKMVMREKIFCSTLDKLPWDMKISAESGKWKPVIVDFTNTDTTLDSINDWAAVTLKHPAKRFLQPGNISTKLNYFAMSVVSFESSWNSEFDSSLTDMRPFYIGAEQNPTRVKTMIGNGRFQIEYIDDLDATVVILPFKNNEADMYIFFPKDRNNIHLLTKNLGKINIIQLRNAHYRHMHIELPFFKVDEVIDVGMTLREMDPESVRENIEIFQKIYIEITEKGSGFQTANNPPTVDGKYLDDEVTDETDLLLVNHAFLFQIVTKEGLIILSGRINKPSYVDYNDRYAQPIDAMVRPNEKENDVQPMDESNN